MTSVWLRRRPQCDRCSVPYAFVVRDQLACAAHAVEIEVEAGLRARGVNMPAGQSPLAYLQAASPLRRWWWSTGACWRLSRIRWRS